MKRFLRRIRGVVGTGITWAIGWVGLFGAYLLVRMAMGASLQGYELFFPLLEEVFVVGSFGFLAGSTFGGVLSVLERHTILEELSLKRIALWGGLGGFAVATLLTVLAGNPTGVIFYTVLGAGSATGTVALAKRGNTRLIEGEAVSALNLEEGGQSSAGGDPAV